MWLTGLVAPRHVGSSQTRARTRVPCISRQTLNHCATREAPRGEAFVPPGPAPGPHSPHQPSKRGLPVSSLPQPTTTSTSLLIPHPTPLQVQSCQGGNGGLTLASLLQTRLRTPLEVGQCVPLNTHTHTHTHTGPANGNSNYDQLSLSLSSTSSVPGIVQCASLDNLIILILLMGN